MRVGENDGLVHRARNDRIAGSGHKLVLVGDMPVNRTGTGGESFGKGPEGQTLYPSRIQKPDRRLDDPLPGERLPFSRSAQCLLDPALS